MLDIGFVFFNLPVIAEHLGFTIDSKTVDRQAERIEEDGTVVVETVPVRRTAYYLPKKIRNILNGDSDLLAYARARKKTLVGEEENRMSLMSFKGLGRSMDSLCP